MPHLHILTFGEDYIPWQEVRWWWMNVLGVRQVSVDVGNIDNIAHATAYVAKYIGKVSDYTLDNDAYLNTVPPGRCWGFYHKNLIAMCPLVSARIRESDEVASLRDFACPEKVELLQGSNGTFTVLGKDVACLSMILFGQGLDGELNEV